MEEVKFVSYHYLWFINKKSLYVQRIQTVLKTRLLIIIQQEQLQFQQPELQSQRQHQYHR